MGRPATEEPNCVDSQESTQFFKNISLHTFKENGCMFKKKIATSFKIFKK